MQKPLKYAFFPTIVCYDNYRAYKNVEASWKYSVKFYVTGSSFRTAFNDNTQINWSVVVKIIMAPLAL